MGEVETPIPLCYGHDLGTRTGRRRMRRRGVTAGRTNPYNRARFSDDARSARQQTPSNHSTQVKINLTKLANNEIK